MRTHLSLLLQPESAHREYTRVVCDGRLISKDDRVAWLTLYPFRLAP